ncbi:glucosaminidase domain-containing protein [Caedibacter taeniospiralis]|uniref:glucosaminidase domain-containing protein n=1 Tax=Caedibacter taeniospiralis TaxID=28907 RepID=UPI0037C1888F
MNNRTMYKVIFYGLLTLNLGLGITSCSKKTEVSKPDFQSITDIKERKQAFIDYMLPLIHEVQTETLKQRKILENIITQLQQGKTLSKCQTDQLSEFSIQYKVAFNPDNLLQVSSELITKINTIPTSMVLAQSALETGWGTSRFAVDGNNYFGQNCFTKGCGIVPKQRLDGAINEVQIFSTPKDSIQSYFNLLNTGAKFNNFRELRAKLTQQDEIVTGQNLIKTLVHYSELEDGEYENRILSTMDYNNLYQYD